MVQEKAKPVAGCLQSIICFRGGEGRENSIKHIEKLCLNFHVMLSCVTGVSIH